MVHNESQEAVSFVPIDHCIDLRKPDGKMDNRCDCCLFHHDTIAFVELKKRGGRDTRWIREGVEQLRATIKHFEKEDEAKAFRKKKAYIANSMRPLFRSAQAGRMERFSDETGYVLRIESHIKDL